MPYVTMSGVKYHYSARTPSGRDPKQAVVFMHGAGGNHAKWHNQISFLGRDFLAIAVDLPGHGLSGGTPFSSIEAYSDFINSFSECLLGSPFFLAGHSMGGAIALDLALNYPERLAGLILVGTGSRLRVLPSILESFKSGKAPENMAAALYAPGTQEAVIKAAAQEIESTNPSIFYSDFTACDHFDVSGRLGEIDVPALVVTGDTDIMTPVKYGQYLKDNLKNSDFKVVENSGHMLMLEQPEKLNDLIYDFLIKHSK